MEEGTAGKPVKHFKWENFIKCHISNGRQQASWLVNLSIFTNDKIMSVSVIIHSWSG